MIFNNDLFDCISCAEIHLKMQVSTMADAEGNIPEVMSMLISGKWVLNMNGITVDEVYYTSRIIDNIIKHTHSFETNKNRGIALRWIAQHLYAIIGSNMTYIYETCSATDLQHLVDSGHFNALLNGSVYEEKPNCDLIYQPHYIETVLKTAIVNSDFSTAEYISKFYRSDYRNDLFMLCVMYGNNKSLDWCERCGVSLLLQSNDIDENKALIGNLRYLDMAKRIYANNPNMFDHTFELIDLVYKRPDSYYARDVNTTAWLAKMMRFSMPREIHKLAISDFEILRHASEIFDYSIFDWLISNYHVLLKSLNKEQKISMMNILFSIDYVGDGCESGLLAKFTDICYQYPIHTNIFKGFTGPSSVSARYLSTSKKVIGFDLDIMEYWIICSNIAVIKKVWVSNKLDISNDERIKLIAFSIRYLKVSGVEWLIEHTKIKTISEMELLTHTIKEEAVMLEDNDMKIWVYHQLNFSPSHPYMEAKIDIRTGRRNLWILEFIESIYSDQIDLAFVRFLSTENFHELISYFLETENISMLRKIRSADKQRFDTPKVQKSVVQRSKYSFESYLIVWLVLECGYKIPNEAICGCAIHIRQFVEMQNGASFADIQNSAIVLSI